MTLDDLQAKRSVLTPEEIKSLYSRICARKDEPSRDGGGWIDVRALEIAVGREFRSTDDMHQFMVMWFSRAISGKPALQRILTMGTILKRKRKAQSLTQKQLADLLNVSQPQIVRYEQNLDPPHLETAGVDEWPQIPRKLIVLARSLLIFV